MKPFLGIDLTQNKKNEELNGSVFLAAKPSEALTQTFESSSEKAEETIERSKLHPAIRAGQWICGAVGALVAVSLLNALVGEDAVSLGEAYHNASWLFWLAGICLLVWLILKFLSAQKEKTILSSDESTHVLSSLDGVCEAIYTELSVPADAKEVDILSFFYKVKDGNIKVCEKGLQIAPYLNLQFKAFADSENLYLANLESKYAFPLSSIQGIRTVKKHIQIISWNKEEAPNKGRYKEYKLTTDDFNRVHCKWYCILEFIHNAETWGIYFPCYELPVFEAITRKRAQ